MPLTYVLDEHFRGILWNALQRHNAGGHHVVDVVSVRDPVDLPLGTKDPDVLLWGEREGRVLVSQLVFVLVLTAHLYDPDEVRDQIRHIP